MGPPASLRDLANGHWPRPGSGPRDPASTDSLTRAQFDALVMLTLVESRSVQSVSAEELREPTKRLMAQLRHQGALLDNLTHETLLKRMQFAAWCETLTQAPVDPHSIDKGIPAIGLPVQLLGANCADHLPPHRHDAIFGLAGLAILPPRQAAWVGFVRDALKPELLGHAKTSSSPCAERKNVLDNLELSQKQDILKG